MIARWVRRIAAAVDRALLGPVEYRTSVSRVGGATTPVDAARPGSSPSP